MHHQFINTATGQESTAVGHDLESCTVDITPVRVAYPANPNAHVVFVETRGFDNGEASDTAILEGVTEWLETTSAFRPCKVMHCFFPVDTAGF
jgi:hypothetical protein